MPRHQTLLASSLILVVSAVTAAVPVASSVASASGSISGRVFQDFNSNGTFNTVVAVGVAADIGVRDVRVAAYDASGAKVDDAVTDVDGEYSLAVPTGSTTQFRIEFMIPSSSHLSAFKSSFAGPDSGTSIQFATSGATDVDYAINVPGEYCQNNPNISVSRLCSGVSAAVNASTSAWITRYDGGPYTTAHGWTDVYVNWASTSVATKAQTGSILGMTWDPSSGMVYHSAYIRRHAELYESGGQPVPAAIFRTVPNGTTSDAVGGSTDFYVDLETLLPGDQFSNSNTSGPGFIPTNSARKLAYIPNGIADGGAENDGVDSDLVTGKDGVFEEVGKAGIGDIESDGDGRLWVVSLYNKNLYQVELPASGTPTSMKSLGDITSGVGCTNGAARPFSVKLWRNSLYMGVVCDGNADFDSASPGAVKDANLSFTIRRYDLTAGTWSTFFGPHPLNSTGNVRKGRADTAWTVATYNVWNPWSDLYDSTAVDASGNGYYWTRPQPMLSEIEFDRDGSMILSFRDRTGDQSATNDAEAPDGGNTSFPTIASGDIYRVCRTGTGYSSGDYVFEGASGCAQTTNTNHGTEYYFGDYWFDLESRGHAEVSVGMSELVPGFPDLRFTAYDPMDGNSTGKTFYSGGVRSLLNSTGAPARKPNAGSGAIFFAWAGETGNPNTSAGFEKTNGMSDVEALCDQAPVQIGNRVWIDADRDGIQDPGEKPIGGVTVRLFDSNGINLLGTAVTNAHGEYFFSSNVSEAPGSDSDHIGGGVEAGSAFIIRFDKAADFVDGGPLAGLQLTTASALDSSTLLDASVDSNGSLVNAYPQISTGTIRSGVNDHTFDVGFVRNPVAMGDYVWIDADSDGVQDPGEQPLAGVRVELFNANGSVARALEGAAAQAVTDASGRYFIDNLQPGQFFAKFTLPSGYIFTRNSGTGSTNLSDSNPDPITGVTPLFTIHASAIGSTVLDTDPGTRANFVDPTVDAGVMKMQTATVGNQVWDDRNGNGKQDRREPGVPGAVLRLLTAQGKPASDVWGRPVSSVTTSVDGRYQFANLAPGSYIISMISPRGWQSTRVARTSVTAALRSIRAVTRELKQGESDLLIDFGLVRASTRRGLPSTG